MWRCCRQQPLSAYDQFVAIAAPRSFSASQSRRRRVNLQCSPIQRPVCLHLLPWRCNSILDGFGMAGSHFLYLLMHNIEPRLPVVAATCNVLKRQRRAKREEEAEDRLRCWATLRCVPMSSSVRSGGRKDTSTKLNGHIWITFFYYGGAQEWVNSKICPCKQPVHPFTA